MELFLDKKKSPMEHTTIEEVFPLNHKSVRLPKEQAAVSRKRANIQSANTFSSNGVFDGLSVPYDISFRRNTDNPEQEIEDFPNDVKPDLVSVTTHFAKRSKAMRRMRAAEILDKLEESKRVFNKDENGDKLTAKSIQNQIDAHQNALNEFIDDAVIYSPSRVPILERIYDHLNSAAEQIPLIHKEYENSMQCVLNRVSESENKIKKAQSERDELKRQLERMQKEKMLIEQQSTKFQYSNRVADLNLRDAHNEISNILRGTKCNKEKLEEVSKSIKERKDQVSMQNLLIINMANEIERNKSQFKETKEETDELEKKLALATEKRAMIEDKIRSYRELRSVYEITKEETTKVVLKNDVGIQFNSTEKEASKKKISNSQRIASGMHNNDTISKDSFQKNKEDMLVIQKEFSSKIKVETVEDLKKVSQLIFKRNNVFDWKAESLSKVRRGDYQLKAGTTDEASIYAKWITEKVLKRTTNWVSKEDKETQVKLQFTNEIHKKKPSKIKSKHDYASTHQSMLSEFAVSEIVSGRGKEDTFEMGNSVKGIDWLIHSIRCIYDQKTVDDRDKVLPILEYVEKWAFRQYGSPKLREKGVIDLKEATKAHRLKSLEVMIFSKFINSEYCAEDLLFFLKARLWLLQRCVSIPMTNESLGIYIIESFLTAHQVRAFFLEYFKGTDPNIIEDLVRRGCDCADPKRAVEESPSIPLMRILELSLSELSEGRIRDMRRILAFFKPLPRMTMKRFVVTIHNIIPNLDDKIAESLFDSSCVPNTIRSDADMTEISKMFTARKIPECENFALYSNKYSTIQSRFRLFSPFLNKIIEAMEMKNGDESRAALTEIRYYLYSVFDARYSCDANLFEVCYQKLLKNIFFICIKNNMPDSFLFSSQIRDFEKPIDAYQKKMQSIK